MNYQTLHEYLDLKEEVEAIARNIVHQKRKESADAGNDPFFNMYGRMMDHSVDDIEFDGVSVTMCCTEYGMRGYTEYFSVKVTIEEFCNPKYLLDIITEK